MAEDGELGAKVTHRVQSGWKNCKKVWNVVRQENEREDQREGVQNSGKIRALMYGADAWALMKAQENKLKVA